MPCDICFGTGWIFTVIGYNMCDKYYGPIEPVYEQEMCTCEGKCKEEVNYAENES